MMIESYMLYIARDIAEKMGKDALMEKEYFYGIQAHAIMEIHKLENKVSARLEDYVDNALKDPDFFKRNEIITFLYNSLGNKKFDNNLDIKEKREIMENSIKLFHDYFKKLKDSNDYKKFKKTVDEKKTGEYIIQSLESKIKDDKELNKIIKSMEEIELNIILEYKNLKIYPLVFDLLQNIVSFEYAWNVDKKLIQSIITEWKDAQESQKKRNSFSYVFYTQMELIEKVKYNNLRRYFLAEYNRVLKVDKKKLRTFMQHILYYIVDNHKNTPKLDFDKIDEILPRPFLLEKTKMIIGGV